MKYLIVLSFICAVLSVEHWDNLLKQGYTQQQSLLRNKLVFSKGSHTVVYRKEATRPTLSEYVQHIEQNHLRFQKDPVLSSMRKNPERQVGSSPDDYFEMIPTYVGAVIPGAAPITWTSNCFNKVNATAEWNNDVLILNIHMSDKISWFCDEGYILGYVGDFDVHFFLVDGWNSIEFRGPFGDDLKYDINNRGMRAFRFPTDVTMTVVDIWETIQLFVGALIGKSVPEWTAEDNAKFLRDHMGWQLEERPIDLVEIDEDSIKSGAFLAIIRFDGLDPMLAWAMGAHTGHTTVTLRVNGELYVTESTSTTPYWPYQDGIQMTPWKQWLQQAHAAGFHVAYIPLSPKYQAIFDEQAAYKFFKSVEGLPYGFHNMMFPWIDTPEDNYPAPLSSEFFMLAMQFVEDFLQYFTGANFTTFDFWGQGLNHRLGTVGLSIADLYKVAGERGISYNDLVTMPEQDSWIYQFSNNRSGPSMVCDVYVAEFYKAAGLFGNLELQGTEFTNWDVYTLNIFDTAPLPKQCLAADPDLPYCQLMGKYRLTLPDFNTRAAHANMAQKCPRGEPPMFHKPEDC